MKEEISAGIILFNEHEKRKFLLLNYPSGHWDFVKGKMEDDETTEKTALRETKEETGISDVEFCKGFEEEIEYYFPIRLFRFWNVLIALIRSIFLNSGQKISKNTNSL